MTAQTFLGIDAGGTHTDAVLCGPEGILAGAKAPTCHEDLPSSVRAALAALEKALEEKFGPEGPARLRAADRVTVGTTLAVNALVQGRADRVALALSAGPGLAPARFAIGDDVCILPGGLDHRGVEVTPLDTRPLAEACATWKKKGVRAVACVGKFSPRNAAHELAMADVVRAAGLTPVCGHSLSGELNFPRRIATAYYNAAVARIVDGFLTAVEQSLQEAGIQAPLRLLKADGGAVPAALARQEPVQSVLSGPAASVMGILALCPAVAEDACSVLLDVGGTTTDVALFAQGSPVVDRDGMSVRGRRTLVRSLASLSIGVGGDSLLRVEGQGAAAQILSQLGVTTDKILQQIEQLIQDHTAAYLSSDETIAAQLSAAQTAYESLTALKAQLDQINTFVTGLKTYTDGVAQAAAGASQLHTGLTQLNAGAATLSTGAAALSTGAASLSEGADSLYDGTVEFKDGAAALHTDGTQKFKDTLTDAEKEAAEKLLPYVTDDLPKALRIYEETRDSAQNSGYDLLPENMKTVTVYIIRTDLQ